MTPRTCSIAPAVHERFPGYVRGVVVAHGLANGPASPELTALLREAEASVRERLSLENITAHPRIAAWREAFKALGIKPNEFRCSVEAMARRALRSQPLPSISALVDLGNALSLKHLVPVGSHALDAVKDGLVLRPALGTETFVAFGSEAVEHPDPGEIVFAEGDIVLTRRWSWRQANHSLTLPETRAIEFNVDGLPPVTAEEVEAICREVAGLIQAHCGGTVRWELLTREHPGLSLEPTR
jgi:DNA/RNA-binding domain of Phe-tRNA-synthetase-like protein